ncbi:MAG: MFS transporter [Halothiobacillaceae bacterium]
MNSRPVGDRLGGILAYGLPGLPLALPGLALYVWLPVFYAEQLGLGLAAVGLAIMLTRLFDVVTDPLVGRMLDRLGGPYRRRLPMIAGAILSMIALNQLLVPPEQAGLGHLYGWALAAYLGWTLVSVPYQAWGAEVDPRPAARTRLSAGREGFAILATVLAAAVPVVIGSDQPGAVLQAVNLLVLLLLPATLLILFARIPEVPFSATTTRVGGLRSLVRDNPSLAPLLSAHWLNGLANGLPAALFLLFVTHRLQAPEAVGPLLLVYFTAGIIALPLWTRLAARHGKARTWLASVMLAAVAFLVVPWLGPGDVAAFAVICLVSGLSLGADMALPASIQADLAGRDRARHGADRSGLLFGLLGLVTKLALAVAAGLGLGLLELSGFDTDGRTDTLALALLYGALPVVLKLAAAAIIHGPVTRRFQEAPGGAGARH